MHQSQPVSNLPSIFHTLLSFFKKIVTGLSAPPEEFLLASLVGVKTLSIVISRNFVEYVFTFPFSVVNDICIVFHFGAEKMMF